MYSKYLIKGDISGIQNFIFNVQSKSAAKTLKAKSFFIEIIGWLAEKRIKEVFPNAYCNYNGGGNFYIEIDHSQWNKDSFSRLQNEFQKAFIYESISLGLSFIECDDRKEYADWLQQVNETSKKNKLSLLNTLFDAASFFETFIEEDKKVKDKEANLRQELFKQFTSTLARSKSYSITKNDVPVTNRTGEFFSITTRSVSLFGYTLTLNRNQEAHSRKLYQHLPLWGKELHEQKFLDIIEKRKQKENEKFEKPETEMVIEFGYLAAFAEQRTGTEKLGVLKLDIDNLGALFQTVKDKKQNQVLSEKLISFFSEHLDKMLDKELNTFSRKSSNNKEITTTESVIVKTKKDGRWLVEKKELKKVYDIESASSRFRQNLYVVFAGGDDCFIIGAWDAVVEFAILLQKEFNKFESEQIRRQLPVLTTPITISASLLIVDSHYPVIKFAELAEDELYRAKHHKMNPDAIEKPTKNKISFLGKVFTWNEFAEVAEIKDKFLQMIMKYGEGKAFLQRIMDSFESEDLYDWQKNRKPFNPSLLWRFLYHYRDIRQKDYFNGKFYSYFFGNPENAGLGGIYKTYLWDNFKEGKEQSQVLPVAARWADFLTRKTETA